jgi:hypothetical protein
LQASAFPRQLEMLPEQRIPLALVSSVAGLVAQPKSITPLHDQKAETPPSKTLRWRADIATHRRVLATFLRRRRRVTPAHGRLSEQ